MDKKNPLLELSFELALEIVQYTEELENKRKHVIARQLLKSGTSIGANCREAQSAESLQDFIHKLKIAAKESEETEYWLLLCKHSKNYPEANDLIEKNLQVKKLLSSIISSSKKRLQAK